MFHNWTESNQQGDRSLKSRKAHKKSRRGCLECKRRHIKCDETSPKCVNCNTAGIECSYSNKRTFSRPTSSRELTPVSNISPPATAQNTNETETEPSALQLQALSLSPVNMTHMELLLRFNSQTYQIYGLGEEHAQLMRQVIFDCSLQYPFLMHEILSIAALDLSRIKPNKDFYLQQSTDLQIQALSGFHKALNEPQDSRACVAFLIFSGLIGRHHFRDTFSFRSNNFEEFLDQFLQSFDVIRGMRAVSTGQWQTIYTSELRPILEKITSVRSNAKAKELTPEFHKIWLLAKSAGFEDSVSESFHKAIQELQLAFNVKVNEDAWDAGGLPDMIFSWPVTLEIGYTQLLTQRNPQALVLMAYFAALLVSHESSWVIGDAGRFLLSSLDNYLGKQWEEYLEWPKQFVSSQLSQST